MTQFHHQTFEQNLTTILTWEIDFPTSFNNNKTHLLLTFSTPGSKLNTIHALPNSTLSVTLSGGIVSSFYRIGIWVLGILSVLPKVTQQIIAEPGLSNYTEALLMALPHCFLNVYNHFKLEEIRNKSLMLLTSQMLVW